MIDLVIIVLYMGGMIGIGFYARAKARTESDFLVAGRRLGPFYYGGTMAALVLGGGATLGGIGLGYQKGFAGVWIAFAFGIGVAIVSLLLAPLINRLKVYTVSQMLQLRYGEVGTVVSGVVMLGYTLLIAVTSTIAYGAIFSVLFAIGKVPAILLGSSVVIIYSVLGGMWSITLTDMVQFIVKTVSIFFVVLPLALTRAGGFEGLVAKLPESAFSFGDGSWIFTYVILYMPTMVVGQDLWQRVFTARNDKVARWAGFGASLYCFAYGLAGALIGMSARVLLPGITTRDAVYAEVVRHVLPAGLAGLVVAGALAAIMSTSSGALIATATVAKQDILGGLRAARGRGQAVPDGSHDEVGGSRWFIVVFGIVMAVVSCVLHDVVAALTLASDFLVGGLMVPVLGGILWRRATALGATTSIIAGIVATLGTMAVIHDIYANTPIYVGLGVSFISFIAVSLLDKPAPAAVLAVWDARSGAGKRAGIAS